MVVNNLKSKETGHKRVRKYNRWLIYFWTFLVSLFLSWNLWNESQETKTIAENTARAVFFKDQAYAVWGASHGGVYVPVTKDTPPNPNLDFIPNRNIEMPDGTKLTLMDPASMLRQMMNEFPGLYGIQGKITSLKYLREGNKPDEWEIKALKLFEQGTIEVLEYVEEDGLPVLRFMRPFKIAISCLKCHAHQGYNLGDVRGGVAITMPLQPLYAIKRDHKFSIIFGHFGLWLVGMVGIIIFSLRESSRLFEQNISRQALQESETRYRALFEESPIPLWEEDLSELKKNLDLLKEKGVTDFRKYFNENPQLVQEFSALVKILKVNNAVLEMYDAKSEDDLIQDLTSIFTKKSFESFKDELIAVTEKQTTHEFETVLKTLTGEEKHVQLKWAIIPGFWETKERMYVSTVDITALKKAENALRESERKSLLLLNSTGEAIYGVDLNGNCTFVNSSFLRILGYNDENQFLGQNIHAFIHHTKVDGSPYPDDECKIYLAFREGQGTYVNDEVFWRKDGSSFAAEYRSFPIIKDGEIMGSVVTFVDITKRKQSEIALKRTAQEWTLALNAFDDVIYLLDNERHLLRANAPFYKLTGLKPEKVIGRHIVEIIHPLGEDTPCPICLAQEEKRDFSMTMEPDDKNNPSGVPLEITVKMLRNEHEKPSGILMVLRDLTKTRKAEKVLRESEERWRTLTQNLPDHVMLLNLDYTIRSINKPIPDLAIEQVIGKSVFDFVPLESKQVGIDCFKRVAKSGKTDNYETLYITTKGKKLYFDVRISLLTNKEGKNSGFISTSNNITGRKKLEEEKRQIDVHLRQQQKLEAIGTLAGGVAHEINNPISGIMNYAQLISKRLEPNSPLLEFADSISRETNRVAKIVTNLLTYARQEKEAHSPAMIADIIDNSLPLIQTVIRRDQIELKVDIQKKLPKIKCRFLQIQQVLMNLLTNARDALNERYPTYDQDKVIKITARLFKEKGKRWIRIVVEDHGSGIPNEIAERVFDPFFTTKDRTKGTGLGLSISLGIVNDHHGRLSFKSQQDKSTRFFLELPVDNGWVL